MQFLWNSLTVFDFVQITASLYRLWLQSRGEATHAIYLVEMPRDPYRAPSVKIEGIVRQYFEQTQQLGT